MARARRRYERPSGLDPLRVSRSHSARRSVAAACPHRAHRLERLEPYEGKLSSTVLRGGRAGNSLPPLDLWLVPISNPRSAPRKGVKPEWRLDKAQQNGAFLRKWPQMLVGGSRKPGSNPCQPRFPRAGWVSTEAKKNQGGPGGFGHPEATLEPPSGHLVANW